MNAAATGSPSSRAARAASAGGLPELAQDGYAVVVGYAGDAAAAEETVADHRRRRPGGRRAQADVADEHAVAALFDRRRRSSAASMWWCNAAGQLTLSPMADLDLADLDDLHRTNIRGTFVVAQQAARRLRAGGALITFSTSVVGTSFPGYGAYAASKGAIEAMTLILARELRGPGHHRQHRGPRPDRDRDVLRGQGRGDDRPAGAKAPPLERLGTPRTSPRSSPSSPARRDTG